MKYFCRKPETDVGVSETRVQGLLKYHDVQPNTSLMLLIIDTRHMRIRIFIFVTGTKKKKFEKIGTSAPR